MRRIVGVFVTIGVAGVTGLSTPAIAAQPATTGSITGTLRSTVDGSPIAGACATATRGADLSRPEYGSEPTAADGKYTITGVPAARNLLVFFAGCDGKANWATEAYGNHEGLNNPAFDPVTVVGGQTTAGINAKLEPGGSIQVTVGSDAGKPLPALAVPKNRRTDFQEAFGRVTDASGNVTLSELKPGKVKLWVAAPGYHAEYYSDQPTFASADKITVTAGGITRVLVLLTPG